MTTRTVHPLASDYLDDLRRAGTRLPRGRRNELVDEIAEHLADAIEPGASDAEALGVLDRLGAAEEIVEAEQPSPTPVVDPPGTREAAAIFLLLLGGLFAGLGWLVGVIFLWGSRAWTTRDKWIGTLVLPGGLAGSLLLIVMVVPPERGGTCATSESGAVRCTDGPGVGAHILYTAILVIVVLAPIVTTAYLVWRVRRSANRA